MRLQLFPSKAQPAGHENVTGDLTSDLHWPSTSVSSLAEHVNVGGVLITSLHELPLREAIEHQGVDCAVTTFEQDVPFLVQPDEQL